jgi:hypothetical protein
MISTCGYDADTRTTRLYNRDEDNEVGFETRKLDLYEGNCLANFMDKLYRDAFEAGRQDLAAKIRHVLPVSEEPAK